MSVPARSRLALAASLLLGGCYVGFDADDELASTSGASTTTAATAGSATSGASLDPATSTEPSGGATSGVSGESTGDSGAAPVTKP